MKRKIRVLIVLAIVGLNAAFVFGQQKSIEKDAFNRAVQNAQKKLADRSYRRTNVFEVFDNPDAAPTMTTRTVTEFALSGAIRWQVEEDGKKYEMILVEGKRYRREGGGKWQVEETKAGYGQGCGAQSKDATYTLVENVKLNGKTASLYENSVKMIGNSCGMNGTSADEVWTERYWIAGDGTLLKTERIVQDMVKKNMHRDVTVFEFDPNIKIVAPIK